MTCRMTTHSTRLLGPLVFCFVSLCRGESLRDHHRNEHDDRWIYMYGSVFVPLPALKEAIDLFLTSMLLFAFQLKMSDEISLSRSLSSFFRSKWRASPRASPRRRRHKFFIIRLQIMMAFPNVYISSVSSHACLYISREETSLLSKEFEIRYYSREVIPFPTT